MSFYDRLEAVLENARLPALLDGVAAAAAGLIAATTIQLGWNQATGPDNVVIHAVIFAVAPAVTWPWKSPLAAPLAIALGDLTGTMALV